MATPIGPSREVSTCGDGFTPGLALGVSVRVMIRVRVRVSQAWHCAVVISVLS